jgi:uncharacterized protein (TIGR02001 family)
MACAIAFDAAAEVDLRLKAAVASNSVYRGLKLTHEGPVYQGLVEVSGALSPNGGADSGWYAGVWASSVDYETDERRYELDFFAGVHMRWSDWIATDTTLLRYTFDEDVHSSSYDWSELQVAAHIYDRWTLLATVADDWIGRAERHYVLEATYRHPLPMQAVGYVSAGHQFVEDVINDEYSYWQIGVTKPFAGFDFSFEYADVIGIKPFGPIAEQQVSFSIARRFTL